MWQLMHEWILFEEYNMRVVAFRVIHLCYWCSSPEIVVVVALLLLCQFLSWFQFSLYFFSLLCCSLFGWKMKIHFHWWIAVVDHFIQVIVFPIPINSGMFDSLNIFFVYAIENIKIFSYSLKISIFWQRFSFDNSGNTFTVVRFQAFLIILIKFYITSKTLIKLLGWLVYQLL